MNKTQLEFFNHEKNILPLDNMRAIRQETFNGVEHIVIKMDDIVVFEIFKKIERDAKAFKEEGKQRPKHTGGKPSYIKIMTDYLNKNDISIDCIGLLVKLSIKNITWNTGKLTRGKGKYIKPLTLDDMCEITHKSKTYISETIRQLKGKGIIKQDKEGYSISHEVIQKGGVK
jgi:hypothetical protein